MFKHTRYLPVYCLGILFVAWGCSTSDDLQACKSDSPSLLEADICLVFDDEDRFSDHLGAIEQVVVETVASINQVMPIDELVIRIGEDPALIIPEVGVGGYNPSSEEVIISIDLDRTDLTQVLEMELAPILAHEIHHARRRRSVGYGATLLEAAITEGLADHFSIEITGIDPPPWSVALMGAELQNWIDIADDTWTNGSYNHGQWFLGAGPDIPRWAGYAIGFELVKNYLSDHPDKLPSTLVNEPAASFLP